jgi:hypothetical protein
MVVLGNNELHDGNAAPGMLRGTQWRAERLLQRMRAAHSTVKARRTMRD